MYKLNYDPLICENCTTIDCLTKCYYIDVKDKNEAKEERMKILRGEYSKLLQDCETCYGCEEYCPNKNHPFYQIVELQERLNIKNVSDDILDFLLKKMGPKGDISPKKFTSPIINMCLFPKLIDSINGVMFHDASIVWGRDIFCNIMWLHFANMSVILERLPLMIKNIYENYIIHSDTDEIICFHDECYSAFTHLAPAYGIEVPFRPIHLFDYLLKKLDELKEHIRPLNEKIVYQRPCSNRLCPEMDKKLDEIFDKIGVIRLPRAYDRENALCCGSVINIKQRENRAKEIQMENIEDMKKSGAKIVVFNCPMCMMTLEKEVRKNGLQPYLVSDLVKRAVYSV